MSKQEYCYHGVYISEKGKWKYTICGLIKDELPGLDF
jgi:hypothetical protein